MVSSAQLSSAASSVWAKTGDGGQWMPLYQHMRDTAAAASVLWDRWLPESSRRLIADGLPRERARQVFLFLAAAHDIGKATPAFANQSPTDYQRMNSAGLPAPKVHATRGELWHSVASMIILERVLSELGWSAQSAESWAVIPGSHHGKTPEHSYWEHDETAYLIGDHGHWGPAQNELTRFAFDIAGIDLADIADLTAHRISKPSQVISTAGVILADWLASDTDRFPLDGQSPERTENAIRSIGLPAGWTPPISSEPLEEFYRTRFSSEEKLFVPRPSQITALEVARSVARPGLIIVEAPMGEGKTEAGLAIAETFAAASCAGGVMFALPTMSTADGIFNTRFGAWAARQMASAGTQGTVHLAHSRSAMNDTFTALPVKGKLAQICDDDGDDALVAHEWLSGGKKGVLASFVVGTIDQVLISALRANHVMLRHLALTNKVLVIDEVHAADAYMAVYLDRALAWCGVYGIPVVLLSATLPSVRRKELLAAYSPEADSEDLAAATAATGYPLITATDGTRIVSRTAPRSTRSSTPEFRFIGPDTETVMHNLRIQLAGGGVAAVIVNTVGRAQEMAVAARAAFPDADVTLAHSRFVAQDRARIESELLAKFGPDSTSRPATAIVIGTQVLEQSLDVDFDVMFTDHAPADLLLQRTGRLQRHDGRVRPAALTVARCFVLGAPELDSLDEGLMATPSRFIYPEYVLARSAQVIRQAAAVGVSIPEDIPAIVNAVYDPAELPDELHKWWEKWEDKKSRSVLKANGWLLPSGTVGKSIVGWLMRPAGSADDDSIGMASVREGEDTLEVVVAQRGPDGILRTLDHVPGGGHTISGLSDQRVLAASVLRLPRQFAKAEVVDMLRADVPKDWARSIWLSRAIPLILDDKLTVELPGIRASYTVDGGLGVGK